MLRWRYRIIILAIIACLAAAVAYLAVTPNKYIATSVLLIETKQMPGDDDASASDSAIDSTVVESQIEAVRSASLALHVVDKLGLADDPEFGRPKPGPLSRLLAKMPWRGHTPGKVDRREVALDSLRSKIKIERIGRSYVAQIDATSVDRVKAAKIANAIADGYIEEQLSARQDSQQRANKWMEDRLATLRDQAASADKEARAAMVTGSSPGQATPATSSENDFKVQDLAAKARIARASYESYLSRYTQALQLQKVAIPTTTARVLTRAIPPNQPGSPRTSLVLALSFIAGSTLGVLGAFGAEFLWAPIRSRSQLSTALGVRTFEPLPISKVRKGLLGRDKKLPIALVSEAGSGARAAENELRKIKLALNQIDSHKVSRIIGVTSPHYQDGKTTIAYSLALLTAQAGSRTLLIDANMHNSTLARAFCEPDTELFTRFITAADESLMVVHLSDRLSFLGQQQTLAAVAHPADILSCEAMQQALQRAQESFDYVIVDLPPMVNHVEARAIAPLLDRILMVTSWGSPMGDLTRCLENADTFSTRVLGIVINKSPDVRSKGFVRPIKPLEKPTFRLDATEA